MNQILNSSVATVEKFPSSQLRQQHACKRRKSAESHDTVSNSKLQKLEQQLEISQRRASPLQLDEFQRLQQPLLQTLNRAIDRLGPCSSGYQQSEGKAEYDKIVAKFPEYDDLAWADFVQLSSDLLQEMLSSISLTFGAKRALQRLYDTHKLSGTY